MKINSTVVVLTYLSCVRCDPEKTEVSPSSCLYMNNETTSREKLQPMRRGCAAVTERGGTTANLVTFS